MATEVEIIRYEGDLKDLNKTQRAAEQGFMSLEKKAKSSTDNIKTTFNGLGSSIKNALSSLPIGNIVNDLDSAADAARGVSNGLGSIAPAAGNGTKAVGALATALKVGVLGALTAIIFAFTAVVNFFKQADEGAVRLESIFNGLSASADVLQGRFAIAGDKIVSFFTDADGAGSGFLNTLGSIVTKAIPAVSLLVDLGKSIGNTGLAKDMKAAYDEAARLTFEFDAVEDSMRGLKVETTQAELSIQALIKQTKNRGLDISDRLNIVSQAQALENSTLEKNFDLQKQRYDIIARLNLQKNESINADRQGQLNEVRSIVNQIQSAKTGEELLALYQQQLKAQQSLRTIKQADEERQVNALNEIITLTGRSQVVQEKYAAINSTLIEKDITERVEAIKIVERERETDAINAISDAQVLASEMLEIQVNSLEAQKKVLQSYGKDVSAIDLEIARLRQKYAEDDVKRAKEASDKKLKNEVDNAARYKLLVDAENALELQRAQFALKNAEYEGKQESKSSKDRIDLINKVKDAQIGLATQEYQLAIKNKNLSTDERTKIEEKYAQDVIDINRNAQESIRTEEQKTADKRKMLADFAIQTAGQVIDEVYNRQTTRRDEEIQAANEEADIKIKNLDKNKDRAFANNIAMYDSAVDTLKQQKEQNLITEQQYNEQLKALDEKKRTDGLSAETLYNSKLARIEADKLRKEKDIKRQQAIADKQQALFSIAINTAAAVVKALPNPFLIALSIATGAVQAALVASRPIPKFAKGVIGLQGPGTKTSDSITAKLSKGESVMTADETDKHKDTLWAIRNNQFDKHVNEAWVLPAIRKLDKQRAYRESFRDRSMNRLGKRMKDIDLQHLEQLTANNKNVRIGNVNELADAINRRKGHSGII